MVIISCSLLFQKEITRQLDAWGIWPRQQPITELYFADAESIPKHYSPNTDFQVRFSLANTSDQKQTYTYIISQSGIEIPELVEMERGQVTLAALESKTVEQTVKLKDTGEKTQVVVSLQGLPQRINVWLTKR